MAIEPLRWTTTADAGAVLTTVGTALQSLGYTVTANADGWSGRAEVGSKVGRALAGGFVRRMIVNYQVGQGVQPSRPFRPGKPCHGATAVTLFW